MLKVDRLGTVHVFMEGDSYNQEEKGIDLENYIEAPVVCVHSEDEVLTTLALTLPTPQAELLVHILMDTDLSNVNQLSNEVYQFGALLSAKDTLGRKIFSRLGILVQLLKYPYTYTILNKNVRSQDFVVTTKRIFTIHPFHKLEGCDILFARFPMCMHGEILLIFLADKYKILVTNIDVRGRTASASLFERKHRR